MGATRSPVDRVVVEGKVLQIDWDKPLHDSSRSVMCAIADCCQHCVLASRDLGSLPLCFEHASAQLLTKKQKTERMNAD